VKIKFLLFSKSSIQIAKIKFTLLIAQYMNKSLQKIHKKLEKNCERKVFNNLAKEIWDNEFCERKKGTLLSPDYTVKKP
jgi:hypothetical protein